MKKITSILLALCLVLSLTVMAAASEDPAVQASYNAYLDIQEAIETRNLEALLEALSAFETANEALTDEQMEAFMALAGDGLFDVVFEAASISGMYDIVQGFLANPDVSNALLLTESYEDIFSDGVEEGAFSAVISDMVPDVHDAYRQAVNCLPGQEVLDVYYAYQNLASWLDFCSYDEDFILAYEAFAAVEETLNTLTEEQFAELSMLLELENAAAAMEENWSFANVVHSIGQAIQAYTDAFDAETAQVLVKLCEDVFGDSALGEERKEALYYFFMNIEEIYNEAVRVMNGEPVERPDPVLDSYNAFLAVLDAIDARDLDALTEATMMFESANQELSDEQMDALVEMAGEDFYSNLFLAAYLDNSGSLCRTFQEYPNVHTALDFAENYKLVYEDGAVSEEEARILTDMIPEIHEAYAEALALLPAREVLDVYETAQYLSMYLEAGFFDGDFVAAMEELAAGIDIFRALDAEALEDLGELMDEEAPVAVIEAMWATAQTVLKVGEAYDGYCNAPSKSTAGAFVEVYDSVYGEEAGASEDALNSLEWFFGDLTEAYAEAQALLAEVPTETPDTGDSTPLLLLAVTALLSLAATGILLRKRARFFCV